MKHRENTDMHTRRRLPILAGSALLAALLAAGGTFALWNNSGDVGDVTLTAGNLDISDIRGPEWEQTSDDVDNPGPINPHDFKVRQGDTFTVTYDFTTELQGDNMLGELSVDWSDPQNIPDGIDATYMLYDDGDRELLDGPADVGTSAALSDEHLQAGNAGRSDEFSLVVSLDFDGLADRFGPDSDAQIADLGTFDVDLHQIREGEGFN